MEGIKGGSEKISVVATCGSIIAALIMFAAGCNRDQWILKSYDIKTKATFSKRMVWSVEHPALPRALLCYVQKTIPGRIPALTHFRRVQPTRNQPVGKSSSTCTRQFPTSSWWTAPCCFTSERKTIDWNSKSRKRSKRSSPVVRQNLVRPESRSRNNVTSVCIS